MSFGDEGTVSFIEIVWLCIVAVCIIVGATNWHEVKADLDYWRDQENSEEAVGFDIKTDLAVETLLLLVQFLFLILGVMAALLPARPDQEVDPLARAYVIVAPIVIIGANLCLLFISLAQARARYVQKMYSHRRDRRSDDQTSTDPPGSSTSDAETPAR